MFGSGVRDILQLNASYSVPCPSLWLSNSGSVSGSVLQYPAVLNGPWVSNCAPGGGRLGFHLLLTQNLEFSYFPPQLHLLGHLPSPAMSLSKVCRVILLLIVYIINTLNRTSICYLFLVIGLWGYTSLWFSKLHLVFISSLGWFSREKKKVLSMLCPTSCYFYITNRNQSFHLCLAGNIFLRSRLF